MTGQGGDGTLTHLSVNLTPAARSALEESARRSGLSRTDVVNIAVMLFGQIAELADHDGVYRMTWPDLGGRPLYLKTSRRPWDEVTPR